MLTQLQPSYTCSCWALRLVNNPRRFFQPLSLTTQRLRQGLLLFISERAFYARTFPFSGMLVGHRRQWRIFPQLANQIFVPQRSKNILGMRWQSKKNHRDSCFLFGPVCGRSCCLADFLYIVVVCSSLCIARSVMRPARSKFMKPSDVEVHRFAFPPNQPHKRTFSNKCLFCFLSAHAKSVNATVTRVATDWK